MKFLIYTRLKDGSILLGTSMARGLIPSTSSGPFTNPESITLVSIPLSYEITRFSANDYINTASTIITFKSTLLDIEIPIAVDTFIAWNDKGRIV